jgi:hypothetical protein
MWLMIYLAVGVLYLIAAILGTWSASLVWRAWHASRLQRRARRKEQAPTITLSVGRRRFGLFVALVALPLAGVAFAYAHAVRADPDQPMDLPVLVARGFMGVCLFLAVGALYVAFRFDPSQGRRRCPGCWYDLSATAGLKCPECGHEAGVEKSLYRTRRAPRLAILALFLLAGAYASWATPRVVRTGFAAAIPTTVLILGFSWLPDQMIDAGPASLGARASEEELWGWQKELLRYRAAGIIRSSGDFDALNRAARILSAYGVNAPTYGNPSPVADLHLGPKGTLAMLRAACDPVNTAPPSAIAGGALRGPLTPQVSEFLPATIDPSVADEGFAIVMTGLTSQNDGVRFGAVSWLHLFPEHAEDVLPHLRAMIDDQSLDKALRITCVWQLGQLGMQSEPAWNMLTQCAAHADPLVRTIAFRTIAMRARNIEDVNAVALAAIDDPDPGVASMAAWSYLRTSTDPAGAARELLPRIRANPRLGANTIMRLVEECPPEEVVGVVDVMLASTDPTAVEAGCMAAGALGKFGEPLLARLRALVQPSNPAQSWTVQAAINEIENALRPREPVQEAPGDGTGP